MKRLLIILTAVLLSGCAATPMEIREMNRSFVVQSDRTPYSAASCIARNVGNVHGTYTASVREGETPNSYEVILSISTAMSGNINMAVVDVTPQEKGSQLSFYFLRITIQAEVNKLLDAGRKCQS